MKKTIKHYLISMPTVNTQPAAHMHAYLMSADEDDPLHVAGKMEQMAKERGIELLPMVLVTTLADENGMDHPESINYVRDLISRDSKEAKRAIETATDFHVTVFMTPTTGPDDAPLMALH